MAKVLVGSWSVLQKEYAHIVGGAWRALERVDDDSSYVHSVREQCKIESQDRMESLLSVIRSWLDRKEQKSLY